MIINSFAKYSEVPFALKAIIIAIGIIRLITTYNKYYKWLAFTYFLESFVVLNEAYVFNTIPNDIIIDLAGTDIGTSIKISYVKLDQDVVPTISDRDFVIATVAAPTVIKEPEKPAEAETAEGTEGEASAEGTEATAAAGKEGDAPKKDDKGKDVAGDKKATAEKKAPEKK